MTSHSIKSVVKTGVNIPVLGCGAGKEAKIGIATDVWGIEGDATEPKPGVDAGLCRQNRPGKTSRGSGTPWSPADHTRVIAK